MSHTCSPETQYDKLNMQFFLIVGAEKILLHKVFHISADPGSLRLLHWLSKPHCAKALSVSVISASLLSFEV